MELVELRSVADVITGFPFKSKFYGGKGIRTVRGENITEGKLRWDSIKCWNEPFDKKEYYSLKENDIVIGMDGSKVGKNKARIKKNDLPLLLAQRVACVRAKKHYDQVFLFYCINNPRLEDYVARIQTGSSVPHISKTQIENFQIPYLELSTQKQIAKVLSDLDYKIEINNKINTELEAMAKLIYEYWFVQFDFPDANGKPHKASGGKMVYNKKLKKEIPEGWQDKTIADWIEKDKSGDWGKESAQGNYTEQVSCIRGADINGLNGNGVVKAPERFILEKNTHKLLEEGDLIIEMSGGSPTQSTGRMAFITQETLERFENPLICSNFCKAVTLKDEIYLYNFVYQWQRLYDAGVLFGWEGKTSGIKNLLFESFVTNYNTVFPKKDIVEKFYQKIKPIHAKKQKNLRENQKLADLRDWLLPMLMNGQVTVKEAKELINQAAEPQENYG
ncbi:restriction endonuclease subunit S [Lacinutrix sp. WUR7]|uniref:restriction endonuclease subunit S n=1 Tax=Lacinutrix sp. WUR7 TaxID=2653681 RepID=UPI00193E2FB9|nr:restriction endonuclease subunit S [Lacinutrix sp. WUR7]QRM89326.1 restriction endonuclease subunit S [Lacinutrix sp. WUR7]